MYEHCALVHTFARISFIASPRMPSCIIYINGARNFCSVAYGSVVNEALPNEELVFEIVNIFIRLPKYNLKFTHLSFESASDSEYQETKITILQRYTKVMERKSDNEPNDQFMSAIRGLCFTLNYLGLWSKKDSQFWYDIIWYVQTIGMLFYAFGPTAGLIVHRHDAKKVMDVLGFVIPTTCTCVKWLIFSAHQKMVGQLFNFMEEDWNNHEKNTLMYQSVPGSKRIMATCSRLANIFFYTYVTVMLVSLVSLVNFIRGSIAMIISHNNNTDFDKFLPIPHSWYPLGYNRGYNFQLLAVTQIITLPTMILSTAAIDATFVSVTLHLCGQFKIVRHFIEGIEYDSSRPEICKTKVKLMVHRHQLLLSVGASIQNSYSLIILYQLMCCTASICFLGYICIVEFEKPDPSRMVLLNAAFLCGLMLQGIFSYCVVGDFLTDQSIAITTGVFNSHWYNSTQSISASFLLVMIRAGRPLEITGASFMTMSLGSFMTLMKAASSYLSVLRAIGVGQD